MPAFEEALAGRPERLATQLGIQSGLPGTRMNVPLAQAFAAECVHRGKAADRLAFGMAELSADAAPGASPKEFLPVCGVLAIGARAAADPKLRRRALPFLHDAAEDLRFRVREAVPLALAKMGAAMGDALVREVAPWMDGFFQAAAVLLAMADAAWLPAIDDANEAIPRPDAAFALAKDAPRPSAGIPGRRAVVEGPGAAPPGLGTRFGVPVFEMLGRWSATEMPELRAAVVAATKSGKLAGRYKDEVARVQRALDASVPPPRDPTQLVKGMRSRGKKRGRR